MKKVKFMLLSMALVAVVGGALAFKVKTSNHHFCSTIARQISPNEFTCLDVDDNPLKCPNFTFRETVDGGTSQIVYCTTPDVNGQCLPAPDCDLPTRRTIFNNK